MRCHLGTLAAAPQPALAREGSNERRRLGSRCGVYAPSLSIRAVAGVDRRRHGASDNTVTAPADAHVDAGGTPTKYSSLQKGDKLSFWVPESKWGFYAAPQASQSNKFTVVEK